MPRKSFGPSGPHDYSRRAKGSAGAPSGSATSQGNTPCPPRHPVELIGIEPTTSGLQSQRSPN